MKYRHVRTGAIIDIECEISGAWEPAEKQTPAPEPEKQEKAPAQKKKQVKK